MRCGTAAIGAGVQRRSKAAPWVKALVAVLVVVGAFDFLASQATKAFSVACADNSGAFKLRILSLAMGPKMQKGLKRYSGNLNAGDVVTVVGRTGAAKNKIMRAILVRTGKVSYPLEQNGIETLCDRFAAVIVDGYGNPVGSEVYGPIDETIKAKWPKIAAITIG
mmetsp:Transcript_48092/g.134303  ORF Transcript_48092/g.134303 Transcript_48092/m.134303 type:complete len:165 (+) Transcript_48092:107-601(+)